MTLLFFLNLGSEIHAPGMRISLKKIRDCLFSNTFSLCPPTLSTGSKAYDTLVLQG